MDDNHNYISDEELAAFMDGNSDEKEVSCILSSLADNGDVSEVLSLSEEIDEIVERENRRIIPMWALAAANPHNMCSFDCETFILERHDFDIDHWSLLETAKANNWVREEGTPLHHVGRLLELKGMRVERKYDAALVDMSYALEDCKEVIAVVDRNILVGEDSGNPSKQPAYHAIYVTEIDENGDVQYLDLETLLEESIEKDEFLEAWKCSGNYMVVASLSPTGYNPQPIDVDEIDLDGSLEDLTEAIAENAHDIWARARMDEGWTYGPVRDDVNKRHPDLVPYAQLSESEKEYDRLMAMNTLRLVRRLGFDIVNNINCNDDE